MERIVIIDVMRNNESSMIQQIMSLHTISVGPETSILEIHKVLSENGFSGVPVVANDNTLLGIVTEYDLIAKGSAIHLPTFQQIISELDIYSKDKGRFKKDIEKITQLKARDVMNSEPITLSLHSTLEDAINIFEQHHRVNPVPVIDENKKVVGIVSRTDILKIFNLIKEFKT